MDRSGPVPTAADLIAALNAMSIGAAAAAAAARTHDPATSDTPPQAFRKLEPRLCVCVCVFVCYVLCVLCACVFVCVYMSLFFIYLCTCKDKFRTSSMFDVAAF